MNKNQSPYMLETASNYLRAAKLICNEPNLVGVSMVNAAVAIEIILKSFSASPVENDRIDTVGEQYEIKGKRAHLLTDLTEKIDGSLYRELGFHRHEYWFNKYNNLFVGSRYPYEKNSFQSLSSTPIEIGIEMFNSTMKWYKESGNEDPWVKLYPEVAGGRL